MGKKDKEFGEWKGTTVICGKVSIKRYKYGFTIKERGKEEQRIKFDRETNYHDMANEVNTFYYKLNKITPPKINPPMRR